MRSFCCRADYVERTLASSLYNLSPITLSIFIGKILLRGIGFRFIAVLVLFFYIYLV